MKDQLFRAIVGLQILVIMSLFAFIAAGDQIIMRLNANPLTIELSEASLDK